MDDFEKRPVRRRVFDGVTRSLVLLGAGLTIALLVALIGYILGRGGVSDRVCEKQTLCCGSGICH